MTLDWEDQLKLILSKSCDELTEDDKAFLKARESYVDDKSAFPCVFGDPIPTKTYADLEAEAKYLGITWKGRIKGSELQRLINEANQ